MRTTTILFLFIAITLTANTQTACNNYEKMQSIPANYDNTSAKFARTYWAKRCACESGNITSGTWDNSVEIMNRMYDNYQDPNFLKDYEGDPFPIPDKRMKVSDCKNGNNSQVSANASTNCDQRAFDSQEDPQNFGNQYMMARCQCLEGVSSVKQAEQLVATMKINRQSVQQYYGNGFNLPQDLKVEDCPILEAGRGQTNSNGVPKKMDKWEYYKDDIINQNAQGLIHELAAESNNPTIKQLSDDLKLLDETNQKIADYNSFFNRTPTQRDKEFQQVMDNAGQIIAVGKAVVSLFKEEDKKDIPFTQDELNGLAAMQSLKRKMKDLSYEEPRIPNKEFHGEEGILELNELASQYYSYDIATAVERRILIQYFYGRHRYTPSELEKFYKKFQAEETETILKEIEMWQNKANLIGFEFAANAEVRQKKRMDLIKIKKASCYLEIGDETYAQELLSEIQVGRDLYSYLHDLENKNLLNGEYSSADANYQLLKIEVYKESYEVKSQKKSRIVKLLAVALSQKEPYETIAEVENELDFIKKYAESPYKNDGSLYRDECDLYIKTLEALLAIRKGDKQSALSLINEAEELSSVSVEKGIISWVQFVKFKVLVGTNKYDDAIRLYDKQMYYLNSNWNPKFYFNVSDLRFMKCKLLYENGEYERALKGLEIVETSTGTTDRITFLRAQVYNAKGETEKAKELLNY